MKRKDGVQTEPELINLTDKALGYAFQILSAPPNILCVERSVDHNEQPEYEYFEFDNAIFRKRADSGLSAVDDVWFPSGWTPYKGDRQEKFMFGDRLDPARLPQKMRG